MNRHPGVFITFEGGEGAGKSSLIRKLSHHLTEQGFSLLLTREPGGTFLGEKIRSILLNHNFKERLGLKSELLLFLAARAQHIEEIILPALQQGKIVLCDRFNDSSIAYQGAGRKLGFEYTMNLCHLACNLEPDLTLFLAVDPKVGLSRTRASQKENAGAGEVDRIEAETLEFHERVNEAFHLLAEKSPNRIKIIDANLSIESVYQQSIQYISALISGLC